jgi:hypothetical protein
VTTEEQGEVERLTRERDRYKLKAEQYAVQLDDRWAGVVGVVNKANEEHVALTRERDQLRAERDQLRDVLRRVMAPAASESRERGAEAIYESYCVESGDLTSFDWGRLTVAQREIWRRVYDVAVGAEKP